MELLAHLQVDKQHHARLDDPGVGVARVHLGVLDGPGLDGVQHLQQRHQGADVADVDGAARLGDVVSSRSHQGPQKRR